jgi:hypothetical protein
MPATLAPVTLPGVPTGLAGRLYLLACAVDKERPPSGLVAPHLVRAGALAELRLRGLLGDSGGPGRRDRGAGATVRVLRDRAAEPALDALLDEIDAARRGRSWTWWVGHRERSTVDGVCDQLAAGEFVEVSRSKTLGLIPRTRVRVVDPAALEGLRRHVLDLIAADVDPAHLDPAEVALVALLAAGEVLSARERRVNRRRLAEFADEAGPVPTALRKVIRDKRTSAGAGAAAASAGAVAASA